MQNSFLVHHGIKGQKWGIRRFQNEDGSWTEAGQKRRKFGTRARAMRALKLYSKGSSQVAKNRDAILAKAERDAEEVLNNMPNSNLLSKKQVQNFMNAYMNSAYMEAMSKNKNIRRAEKIVDKYEDVATSDILSGVKKAFQDADNRTNNELYKMTR